MCRLWVNALFIFIITDGKWITSMILLIWLASRFENLKWNVGNNGPANHSYGVLVQLLLFFFFFSILFGWLECLWKALKILVGLYFIIYIMVMNSTRGFKTERLAIHKRHMLCIFVLYQSFYAHTHESNSIVATRVNECDSTRLNSIAFANRNSRIFVVLTADVSTICGHTECLTVSA